ncbi:hypothetical protein CN503_25800 [Bacillus cereus]|uniref:hypothetical protein n=1 Tax=Bacillus cereus TaxID=1396 RepID=UPI000B7E6517|nr:hypothetical protein [Bacillus cereus]PER60204.1 hypothetical protein CN503_25800 [Bacillus cereus]PFM01460.1 hypothetical protein COJ39_29255 [Bacillus cereus]
MKSVDKVFGSLAKKQKYLLLRIFSIFFLVVVGLGSIYATKDIVETLFFSTLLLFFGPLFMEYTLGMDTYSKYTNRLRWAGFLLTGLSCFICFVGLMGQGKIVVDSTTRLFSYVTIFGFININALIIQIVSGMTVAIAIGDFVFTLNKQELRYYLAIQKLEDDLETYFKDLKERNLVESRKKIAKARILKKIEMEGGK